MLVPLDVALIIERGESTRVPPSRDSESSGDESILGNDRLVDSLEGLRAWIKSPEQFKPGVLMPAMNLNDADLDKLAAYLATLK